MSRPHAFCLAIAFVFLSTCVGAQSVPSNAKLPNEPKPNLGQLKIRLKEYHDCTTAHCYVPELNHQADLAIAYLDGRVKRARSGEKLALVLDIDETALSNWDEEKQDDFGYIAKDWNDWVDKRQAPAIAGTLRLYNEARKNSVFVFFITGRSQSQETATSDNLKKAGYAEWTRLALRGPHPDTQTVIEFKSSERKKIVDEGYRIILNVGDQKSDLDGSPLAERSIKLPNPFYYIP